MYQILMSCNKMKMNYLKIIQCDFLDFCFRFRHSQLKCTYDKKLQTSTCFVSRKTCKLGSVSNTCSPHCKYIWFEVNESLLQQSTLTTCCCLPRASRLGWCSSACKPPPFSSKHNNGHFSQTSLFLSHQTRGHFSKKYNIFPHVQMQTVVWLVYGSFGTVASSLLSGLSGYVDIGLVLLRI